MRAIKAARRLIESDPLLPAARVFSDLVLSLETDHPFRLSELYELDQRDFALAMDLLGDWRIDRYYMRKAKLLDISWQHRELRAGEPPEARKDDSDPTG